MNALHDNSHHVWCDTVLLGECSWCFEGSYCLYLLGHAVRGLFLHCVTSHKTLMFSNTAHTKCYLPSALELFPTVTYHNFCMAQEVRQDQVSQFCYCNGHTWRISWMYSQAGVCEIQTYTALKDQRLYTCTGNNNITKSVFCDAVHRLYQTLLHLKNAIQFHETHMNVISLTPIRKVDLHANFHKTRECSAACCAHLLYWNS